MQQYLELMRNILAEGHSKSDRTNTGTLSLFGAQMRFNLQDGFPLVTTKRCHLRSIIHELLWFLNGDTNTQYLKDNNVSIWDEWADEYGNLGPVYGKQWREWRDTRAHVSDDHKANRATLSQGYTFMGEFFDHAKGEDVSVYQKSHDQISKVIDQLRNDPDNRRIIVSAWNVGELDEMALAPCHAFFQFYSRELETDERWDWIFDNGFSDEHDDLVDLLNKGNNSRDMFESERWAWMDKRAPKRVLSCQLYQRSADIFLGVPFNIASYSLLMHMVAQQVGMSVGDFVWTSGDAHLYSNHVDQAKLQLSRAPKRLPKLVIKRKPESIFDYKFEDFEVEGYDPHPAIKAPVAI